MNGKLVVADVFDRVFGVYRDQFTLLVPAALIVFVPVAIVNGVLRESGGFGLALIASLAAEVEFGHGQCGRGALVRMTFAL